MAHTTRSTEVLNKSNWTNFIVLSLFSNRWGRNLKPEAEFFSNDVRQVVNLRKDLRQVSALQSHPFRLQIRDSVVLIVNLIHFGVLQSCITKGGRISSVVSSVTTNLEAPGSNTKRTIYVFQFVYEV